MCWGGRNPFFQATRSATAERMAERGWTVPDWPKAYGGGGFCPRPRPGFLRQERPGSVLATADELWILDVGPALLRYGSRRRDPLPSEIARGEIRWCQAIPNQCGRTWRHSRPDAGQGRLAGQWTESVDQLCDKADWIFACPHRGQAPKHQGISFILFDMASEGVSTRPILLISGNSTFCETFFARCESAEGPDCRRSDRGWDVANICSATSAR